MITSMILINSAAPWLFIYLKDICQPPNNSASSGIEVQVYLCQEIMLSLLYPYIGELLR